MSLEEENKKNEKTSGLMTSLRIPTLEEMIALTDPIDIPFEKFHKKLFPPDIVKQELEAWAETHGERTKTGEEEHYTIDLNLMSKKYVTLYNKLRAISKVIDGTTGARTAIKYFGMNIKTKKPGFETYKSEILGFYTKDFVLKVYEENLDTAAIIEYKKKATPAQKSAFEMNSYYNKIYGKKIADIVNEAYPDLPALTEGMNAAEVLGLSPLRKEIVANFLKQKRQRGEDISPSGLRKTGGLERRVLNHAANPEKFSGTKHNKGRSRRIGHSTAISNFFTEPDPQEELFKRSYFVTDKGYSKDIGTLLELEFLVFLGIIAKYDPLLEQFPELKGKINAPIEGITNTLDDEKDKSKLRIQHPTEKRADIRFNAGGESYLVEIKKTDYGRNHVKRFFASLGKYQTTTHWFDGEKIGKKLLYIDSHSENGYLKNKENWHSLSIISPEHYSSMRARAHDLLLENEPDYEDFSVLHRTKEQTIITKLIHEEAYLISGEHSRELRKILIKLLKKDFKHIRSINGHFVKTEKLDYKYTLSLKELGVFPPMDIDKIPAGSIFPDTEDCGKKGPLITISFGRVINGDYVATCYVPRTPFEEVIALLDSIKEIEKSSTIFTYAGDSHDIEILKERFKANFIDYKLDKPSFDLYWGYCFRYFKNKKYEEMSLKTFEETELGIYRRGDIKGDDIKDIYINTLIGEPNSKMRKVIAHNLV
ncbi:MAG: ribonuclease H-like domain-containing protein, partial [Candidatus Nanoarchaeia archaeon]